MLDPINEEYGRLKSMWVATGLMALLSVAHLVALHFIKASVMSSIQKRGYSGPTEPALGGAGEQRSWLFRTKLVARILRDSTLMLLVLTLLAQNLGFHAIPHREGLANVVSVYAPSMVYFVYFAWIIFGLALLQWAVHLIVEPLAHSGDSNYEYFAPGLYGRREATNGRWLDAAAELVKFILLGWAAIWAFSEARNFEWTDAFKWNTF